MPSRNAPDDDRLDALEARLDRLEEAVSALQDQVGAQSDGRDPAPDPEGAPPSAVDDDSAAAQDAPASDSSSSLGGRVRAYAPTLGLRSEDWISYVGVGLLLFGLAFLFKYSIEQGWLTPAVRVGFGVFTGSLLLTGGVRRAVRRPLLQQVLFGGSSATFYGTVFAAYQLYELLPYPLAFASMVFITIVTIALALQHDHSSTALIGTAGGLGAPFLLYTQADGGAGLTLYACLVVAGACAIYLYRGWRSLIYLATIGGWIVLLLPCADATFAGNAPSDAWGVQVSLLLGWLLLGGTPILQSVLHARSPRRWPSLRPSRFGWLSSLTGSLPTGPVTASPLLGLLATRLLWPDVPEANWAIVAGGGALLYGGLYWGLRRTDVEPYAPVHGVVATVLATYSAGAALGGPALLATWAVEATALLALSRRLDDPLLRLAGHGLAGVVASWFALRMLDPMFAESVSTADALSELFVLGTGLLTARLSPRETVHRGYRGLVLAGWLGWSLHELGGLPNGQAYVSVVWGGTAAALLLGGSWTRSPLVQKSGLAVLGLFVGKLFFVDLNTLPTLGRIVLFLGTGTGFLLISYLLPDLGGDTVDETEPSATG